MNASHDGKESCAPEHYFTGMAGGYDRHRPGYAAGAIDAMLRGLDSPTRAASIGCGTGICCRLLAARGAMVIGIDPNGDMLAEATRATEAAGLDIDFRNGTGEQTGLAAGSVNLAVCAQSFHWFDADRALGEFHRILTHPGRLALMWNRRVKDDPFTSIYSDVARRAQMHAEAGGRVTPRARQADPTITGQFRITSTMSFENPQELDEDALLGRLHSASYFPKAGPAREELERDIRAAFAKHSRDGIVTMRQKTELTLAEPI